MTVAHQGARIPAAGVTLEADIAIPEPAGGIVVFAHGSGSSRFSPRNRYVARQLQRAGLATVLADLLTPAEEQTDARTGEVRFDVGLLAARLTGLTGWLAGQPETAGLSCGLFGASTGAAAALVTAAQRPAGAGTGAGPAGTAGAGPGGVRTVVSRGGRPDLAGGHLSQVRQPVLLIVGERDPVVLDLNRQAARELAGLARLVTVPGASHLFEEPGALDQVATLAAGWFAEHLA